jgi:hypothetical protein
MMYREIIAVFSEITINPKHVSKLCGQNEEFLGELAKLPKWATRISFVVFVCLSVHMEQLSFQWTDFYEIR